MFRFSFHRVSFLFAVLVCAVLDTNVQAQAPDPTGTWTWERSFNNNVMAYTLKLMKDDAGKLAGTYSVKRGDTDGEPVELENVKCEGDKLWFSATRSRNGNEFTVHYEGNVSGDNIKGSTKVDWGGQQREFDWIAKRSGADGPSWKSLFDGKTLEGWERVGNEDSKWVVTDGAMTASGPASMLVNVSGPYKNFRYRAECKISDGGNSGLYFRTTRKPGFMDGYEAQIDSTHTDPIRTGSLYGMCHVYKQHVKPDTWFTYDLEVRDDVWRGREMTRIKVTIDGNELYEYMDFDLTFKRGHFAFQHHDPGSIVHIRKVEVMPLSD